MSTCSLDSTGSLNLAIPTNPLDEQLIISDLRGAVGMPVPGSAATGAERPPPGDTSILDRDEEGFTAPEADALNCARSHSQFLADHHDQLIISDGFGVGASHVAAITRRNQVVRSIVGRVLIDVVNDQAKGTASLRPFDQYAAPLAWVLTRADASIENGTMNRNIPVAMGKRVLRIEPIPVPVERLTARMATGASIIGLHRGDPPSVRGATPRAVASSAGVYCVNYTSYQVAESMRYRNIGRLAAEHLGIKPD